MAGTTSTRPALAALALLLLALSGCRAYYPLPNDPIPCTCKPCALKENEPTPTWAMLPQQSKNHVYVYLLNGNDPFNTGNLLGVRDYLHARGFIKTSYGQQFHGPWFESEILDIAARDPNARFVLAGFSAAAGPCNQLARRLAEDGIHVDRLVYIDGVFLFKSEELERPANVEKFVSIHGQGWLVHGQSHEDADNVFIEGAGHFDMPTHAKTLQKMMDELVEVASKVPILVDGPTPPREGPKPTPVVPGHPQKIPPQWDFLHADMTGSGAVSTSSFKPVTPTPNR
jgi:hypothetical protein